MRPSLQSGLRHPRRSLPRWRDRGDEQECRARSLRLLGETGVGVGILSRVLARTSSLRWVGWDVYGCIRRCIMYEGIRSLSILLRVKGPQLETCTEGSLWGCHPIHPDTEERVWQCHVMGSTAMASATCDAKRGMPPTSHTSPIPQNGLSDCQSSRKACSTGRDPRETCRCHNGAGSVRHSVLDVVKRC